MRTGVTCWRARVALTHLQPSPLLGLCRPETGLTLVCKLTSHAGVVLCQEMAAPALAPDSGPALTRQPTEAEVTKAANAILSELRDTKDTSTTSPVELSWLGELMSAHETSGAACPATSSLMRCSTCRRLVLSARAGLHKQQCGAAKPQKQQQAKPVPSRPPRQVAPPPPQATVVPRATAVKSKPRPPVPVDLDLARPTKLSKVTYPAAVSVASKSYFPDFTAVPKRPRAHIPRCALDSTVTLLLVDHLAIGFVNLQPCKHVLAYSTPLAHLSHHLPLVTLGISSQEQGALCPVVRVRVVVSSAGALVQT